MASKIGKGGLSLVESHVGFAETRILWKKNGIKEKIMVRRRTIVTLGTAVFFLCMSFLSLPGTDWNVRSMEKGSSMESSLVKALGPPPAFADQAGTAQEVCPITGKKIDKSVYVDYEGKRVYFCCPGCKATFSKDPDKYVKAVEAKGVNLAKTPGD
jgi:YHS domain-containing protein